MTDTTKSKTIGTHNGTFHCDEALACHLLKLTDNFKDAEIVRSRDSKVLVDLDVIVDVGGEYIPDKGRFDHHQKGFQETFSSKFQTKLSSAGLIYKHFGKEIVAKLSGYSEETPYHDIIYQQVYKTFVEGLDGIDNGVSRYPDELKPRYTVNTDLSSRVGRLNPSWNEKGVDIDAQFRKAMAMAGSEFEERVLFYAKSWIPARAIVEKALAQRSTHHDSGEIVVLEEYTIWKKHLLDLEQEQELPKTIKFVLYQDQAGAWRVQAVPIHSSSFQSRVPLHEPWRGLRDEELSKVSGIDNCIFVHAGGFIGGNKTMEGALAMAVQTLALAGEAEADDAEPAAKKAKK